MTENQYARTQVLLGREGMERLAASRVAVFGIGGVGCAFVRAETRRRVVGL